MYRQIAVDEEVYAALKAFGDPCKDTPNSVLRRKLGLDADAAPRVVAEPHAIAPAASGVQPRPLLLTPQQAA